MKKKVLIVDDNSNNLYMLDYLLKGYGMEVIQSDNGKVALDKAHLDPPDLIITDILMPVMDGYTLCRQWKSDETLKHIPLVFYTATYTEPKDESFALDLGADRFIIKPQEPEILMNIIKEVLEESHKIKQTSSLKPLGNEMEFFRQHNEILFSKLEKKMLDLENANMELVASEIRYRRLFESAKDGILILDADTGMIVDVNPFLIKLLGYSHEQFLGKSVLNLGFLNNIIANKDKFLELQQKEYVRYEDLPLETADGRTIEVEFVSNVYYVNSHRVIQCNIRDITERMKTDKALWESEDKFKYMFDYSVIGKSITLPTGEINVNRAFCEILGYSKEELERTKWQDITHPDDIESTQKIIENLLSGKMVSLRFTKRYIHKNGHTVWVDISTTLRRDKDGKPVYFITSVSDISERKLAEDEIKKLNETLEQRVIERTSQLDTLNKELESFAYSVSHDLRAPLRAIDGFTRFLYEDYGTKFDEEGKRLLNVIRTNTQRMDQLIADMLSLSKITRSEFNYSIIDMNTLANSIYNEVTTDIIRREFEFKVISLPDAFGDANLIRQVWVNLLSNAVKYTMKSKVKKIEVGFNVEDGNNVYYVKDTGAGFDPEYTHKLFGVFQRLHKTEEFEGTGIGLAIVQRIIIRHGGKVRALGKVNEGATFYFSLPVKEGSI